jgi:hypothetical protein
VTTPDPFEGPEAAEMVSVTPRLEESEIVFPARAVPTPSLTVTVIVEVLTPSAIMDAGPAEIVETTGLDV